MPITIPSSIAEVNEFPEADKHSSSSKTNGAGTSVREEAQPEEPKGADPDGADADATSSPSPRLVIDKGDYPKVAEQLRDIISCHGDFFERGAPVRIVKRDGVGLPVAVAMNNHGVVRAAHQVCRPVKDTGENITLPDRVASLYLNMDGDRKLKPLKVISSAPLLSDDGEIKTGNGYQNGVYCHAVPTVELPDRPTREQAEAALKTLRDTFRTFPFADAARKAAGEIEIVDHDADIGQDESAFLCGLLTAVCRQSLPLAPALLLNAPMISGAGTGKGLLVRAISAIAYGSQPRAFTPGHDGHEMDKRIVAEVMEGNAVVFLDNINATSLRSDTLASFLTERRSGVRILGSSQMRELDIASFFAFTGNGLNPSEDLARRMLVCELDARVEDPEQRPFPPGFLEGIAARRIELLSAALTVWRWGRQNAPQRGRPLGNYETWAQWVRDPLLALGCKDPVARVSEIKARDPERQQVAELFGLWWEHHRDDPVRVADLHLDITQVIDPGNKRGRQYHATYVKNRVGTRQGGYRLERVQEPPNARKTGARYRLLQTAPAAEKASASSAPESKTSDNSISYESGCRADAARMPGGCPRSARVERPHLKFRKRVEGIQTTMSDRHVPPDDERKNLYARLNSKLLAAAVSTSTRTARAV